MVIVTSKPAKLFRAYSPELERDILGFELEIGQSNLPKEKLEGLVIGQKNNYIIVKYSTRETKYKWGMKQVPITKGSVTGWHIMFDTIIGHKNVWSPMEKIGEVDAEIIANYDANGKLVHMAKYVNGKLDSTMDEDEIFWAKSKQELRWISRRRGSDMSYWERGLDYYLSKVDLKLKDLKRITNRKITKQYIQWLKEN